MQIVPALIPRPLPPDETPRRLLGGAAFCAALAGGRVHEIYPAEQSDAVAAIGLTIAMASLTRQLRPILWLRPRRAVRAVGVFQANGWVELGGAPGHGVVGVVADTIMLLRAAVDGLRCPTLGAVVVEGWGPMPELDMTASRRLALAAEKSGVPLFLLRCDATPMPSAAQTRWQVAAAPSRALPGNAPGHPTFDITLLRQKSGPCGLAWHLEWDRDQRQFHETQISGDLASLPLRRPAADAGAGSPDKRIAA